ncbi:divalent-cation tolerance protein CutA [Vulcaniibacterium thermophilum]|uniref:Divalent cation tolerance protein n=1 Tax=Vulcaniibacterium thermophilum TaxID=1169913 RepID=A0A919DB94_9GAMM|nr:divalent-cation tolerance protein CutA [Vulcaniibacterium thermophilum]GHE31113.1 divalent cation tolerance protein [Vulcaniibacterium thermophilum]
MSAPTVLLVFSTCPDAASADAIARALVGEGLAACVTRLPGARSTYRWQGAVEEAEEVQLLIKTTRPRLQALAERLRALHPYELPELVAVEAQGGWAPYLQWIAEQTA